MALHSVRLIIFCVVIIFFQGCKEDPVKELTLNEKLGFSDSLYHKKIEENFSNKNFSLLLRDSSQFLDTLRNFYAGRNFEPVFIKSFEEKDFIYSLLNILNKAEEHGLNPDLYHYKYIEKNFTEAVNDTINNPDRHTQLANAEIYASSAILKYAYHMRYGAVNPKKVFPDSYFLPVADSTEKDLFEPLRQENIIEYLEKIQPDSEKYKRLQTALNHFKKYNGIKWETIPYNKKLEVGDKDPSLKLIIERLITLGYMDTSKVSIKDFTFYDSLLIEPVKKFQRLNGLNDDAVVGKSTVEKFNISPEEYVNKIKLSLERFRWIDYSDTSRYILVNIPDFKLYAIEDKAEQYDIKVCTGLKRSANYKKRYEYYKKTKKLYNKPDDWETPAMYGEISYMVLNPTWNVPASIIREEILREVRKDSNYLHNKNFKVYKNGELVDLKEVNINEFSSEKIPYKVVQDPGPGNALGKIKFMYDNPFGIYLHDTPSRTPFTYSTRAVSHGCVRVEKPLKLSEFILKGHKDWEVDYVKIEIGQKPDDESSRADYAKKREKLRKNRSFGQTTEIILDKKLPLFIDYYTAWVDKNGDLNLRDDVYNKDKELLEYLTANSLL